MDTEKLLRCKNQFHNDLLSVYNMNCVFGLAYMVKKYGEFIDLVFYSPPFANLYIYSNDLFDMGNVADNDDFIKTYSYALNFLYKAMRPGGIHCFHLMDMTCTQQYNGYTGLEDLTGMSINEAEKQGFILFNILSVFKKPEVEMTRTKAHALLHATYISSSESVRAGKCDFVVEMYKPLIEPKEKNIQTKHILQPFNPHAMERIKYMYSNQKKWGLYDDMADESDSILYNEISLKKGSIPLAMYDKPLNFYTLENIKAIDAQTKNGRNVVIACELLPVLDENEKEIGKHNMAGTIINIFQKNSDLRFFSRKFLTNNQWLITFKKLKGVSENKIIKVSKQVQKYYHIPANLHVLDMVYGANLDQLREDIKTGNIMAIKEKDENGKKIIIKNPIKDIETYKKYIGKLGEALNKIGCISPRDLEDHKYTYIGTCPPIGPLSGIKWYSIGSWQKYASPVWWDLEGLPEDNKNVLWNIDQGRVLNSPKQYNLALSSLNDNEDQMAAAHLCPLQLDLIELIIKKHSKEGDLFITPFAGFGSEIVSAVRLGRKAMGFELEPKYFMAQLSFIYKLMDELKQIPMEI